MLWTLWDIVVPMALSFALGLMFGWLLWRWRRARISAQKLSVIQRNSVRYQEDNERLQSRVAELRGQQPFGAEPPNESLRSLQDKLRSCNRRVFELEAAETKENDSAVDVSAMQAQIESRDRMIDTLRHSLGQYHADSDQALVALEIDRRDKKIAALENLLANQLQCND